jgi:hypothetical protein
MKNTFPVYTSSKNKMNNQPKETVVKPMDTLIRTISGRSLLRFIPAAVTFACFSLAPLTEAVVPAPDGGYPGGNTAEGQAALASLDTSAGAYNINAMLLNEFLKEHKRVQEQQTTITELKSTVAQQQKGIEVLTAQLEEQTAQIQK